MKKWIIFALSIVLVFVSGCSIYNTNPKEIQEGTSNQTTINKAGLLVDMQDTYYRLQTEKVEIDIDALTQYCLGENAKYMDQAVETVLFPEYEDGRFNLVVEDNQYCWNYQEDPSDYCFIQVDEPYIGVPNEKKALQTAKEIIDMIDVEFSETVNIYTVEWHIELEEGDFATMFEFAPQYKGVMFAGNQPLRTVEGEEIFGGSWAEVTIDADSVQTVGMENMCRVVKELETYSTEDFISVEEAVNAAENECSKLTSAFRMEDPDAEISGGATSITVIYVPAFADAYYEWIPAYKVMVEYTVNGKVHPVYAIVDVFTGHVYDWRGAETP